MDERKCLGQLGEDFAEQVLRMQGYHILERNYRCREGEIDIICEKEGVLFFVEVKTRRKYCFAEPCEAVNGKKQWHLRKAAASYLRQRRRAYRECSFQVFEVLLNQIEEAF